MSDKVNKAFVSALGSMGRRHVKGLIRAGYDVVAIEPMLDAFRLAQRELNDAGLDSRKLILSDCPTGEFDVAIFSETTSNRLTNFNRFLSVASAQRILLEKPLTAQPEELEQFLHIAQLHHVANSTYVNFARRTWTHVQKLAEMCANEKQFSVTLNGGAIGLGCNGIHYLDTFIYFAGGEKPSVCWAGLSSNVVRSGRGEQFEDFGGEFVVVGSRGRLLASLEANSSAGVVMTVRGEHFIAQVDYLEKSWRIFRRKPDSFKPHFFYGADYEIVEQARLKIPSMDSITEAWASGIIALPHLAEALDAHLLLDEILKFGGARPPYRFT